MTQANTQFSSRPSNMQLGCLSVDLGCVLFVNPTIFPVAFGLSSMYNATLLFWFCISVVINLLRMHIGTYFMYIVPSASNLCNFNKVQHTPSIIYIYHNQPLFHPCKTTPNHVMTMVQFDISSCSHKNLCLVKEDTWVPIVSLDVCTLREPWCRLLSHHHKNMTLLQGEKNPQIYGIFFWYYDI